MTTFVNGKLASRTEFPVGSSVGTFAVPAPRVLALVVDQPDLLAVGEHRDVAIEHDSARPRPPTLV
jgi:hypothetical protein